MIRVAATADVHYDSSAQGRFLEIFPRLRTEADMLLIAGDLTQSGSVSEAEILAGELFQSPIPVATVLGNHEYHRNEAEAIAQVLSKANVHVLNGTSAVFSVRNKKVGIAGTKGFGNGFLGACATEFGEPEMKQFVSVARNEAAKLERALLSLATDLRISLTHYSPIPETLEGERREVFPFLGSYFLGEAIDRGGAHIAFHGHSHNGREIGKTPGGVPVRNVAQTVIRLLYKIYDVEIPKPSG